MKSKKQASNTIVKNRKAQFRYIILEKYEAGIELKGTEVKSVRAGKVQISESFCYIRNGEIFINNMNISVYEHGGLLNHSPTRKRKLLLHKREIIKLKKKVELSGLTIVPLSLYFKNGLVKVKIALCKGKKIYDKRETMKKREAERTIKRIKY